MSTCALGNRSGIELETLHSSFKLSVSTRPSGEPLLQTFDLHQRAHFRILERHPEHNLNERPGTLLRQVLAYGEIAMVKGRRRGQYVCGAGVECALIDEDCVVGVEHARGIGGPCGQRPRGIALTAYMVAMLSHHNFVMNDAAIFSRNDASIRQHRERDQ